MKSPILLLCAAALALSSCAAPNFKSQFAAAEAGTTPPYTDITGAWEGTWSSGANGHNGELRCIVSEGDQPNEYDFLYWATWWPNMKGTFKFSGVAEQQGNALHITGAKHIGPAKYNHEATITPTSFTSEFGSDKKNFGEMKLERPK